MSIQNNSNIYPINTYQKWNLLGSPDLDKEAKALVDNGIQYIYNAIYYDQRSRYLKVSHLNFPLTSGKTVYLIASGTNIAYALPHYILMQQEWFKNALDETRYKSVLIHIYRDNIILKVEPPNPSLLNYLVAKLLKGTIGSFICKKDTSAIKELLDYFCIDMEN